MTDIDEHGRFLIKPLRASDFSFNQVGIATLRKVTEKLTEYGTVLSEDHRFALRALVQQLVRHAAGVEHGRVGVPLPMGGGKTLASECFAWALHELQAPIGIVIAVNRLRDMEAFYTDLVGMGVSAEDIGVLHSETSTDKISTPCTEGNDRRRIMLVTHSRLKTTAGRVAEYATYDRQPRALVIYDESLVSTAAWALQVEHLVETVRGVQGKAEAMGGYDSPEEEAAFTYLDEVTSLVLAEKARQEEEDDPDGRRIEFPPLPAGYTNEALVGAIDVRHRSLLSSIFDNAEGGARALMVSKQSGVVWFDVTVPDELSNMVILDASLIVRLLPRMGGDIAMCPRFPERVISYEDVTIYHMVKGMGRSSTDDIFGNNRRLASYCREIAEVIRNGIPEGDAVNLVLYKDNEAKGRRYASKLERGLSRAGVDIHEKLPDGRPRFNLITWGNETATNAYSYAPHTIFVSVLHRNNLDLASNVVAARRDLRAKRIQESLREVLASEVAHGIAQAAGRSAIRRANNGKAAPGTIWLPMRTPKVMEMLTEHALPGVCQHDWHPVDDDWQSATGATKWKAVADGIVAVLAEQRADISSRALRAAVCEAGVEVTDRTWKDAQAKVAKNPPVDWEKVGQRWEYVEQRFDGEPT